MKEQTPPRLSPGFGWLNAVQFCGALNDNLFKFFANLDPTDPEARFHFAIRAVPGESDKKDLVFSPLAAGREYTIVARDELTLGEWAVLESAGAPMIDGDQATVTDGDASDPVRFYRVRIAWPR